MKVGVSSEMTGCEEKQLQCLGLSSPKRWSWYRDLRASSLFGK